MRKRASESVGALARTVMLALLSTGCASASVLPLEVDIRARALSPGEPVRIVVHSEVPLTALKGQFLGEPLFLSPISGNEGEAREWSGWAVVDLDREPGAEVLELAGATGDGVEARATKAVRVLPKEFPTQHLSVDSRYVTPPPEVQERIRMESERLAEVYATKRLVAPQADPFVRPVPGEATSPFGSRRLFNDVPKAPHPGLDLRAALGDEVRAAAAGRVALATDLYYSGKTVILDHGGGLFTLYAHLSDISVREGADVRTAQIIGLAGATGRVTGPHLHWGAKVGSRPFDPTALLDPALFP